MDRPLTLAEWQARERRRRMTATVLGWVGRVLLAVLVLAGVYAVLLAFLAVTLEP